MQYFSDKALAQRFEITRQTVWRWVREGKFPPPVKIGSATTRWREADISAWEAKQGGAK